VEALLKYPKQRELVEHIFDLCLEDPEFTTDMPTLMERTGISRPTILQRLEKLTALNRVVVTKDQVYSGMRSVNVYQLVRPTAATLALPAPIPPDPDSELLEELPVYPMASGDSQQAAFEFIGTNLPDVTQLHYHPEVNDRLAWKGERFTVFSLMAGLRVGRHGKDVSIKQTRIYMGQAWFLLEVRSVQESIIPSIIDLRVLIVVCTLIKEHLDHAENQGDPNKGYLLSMTSICQAMDMPAIGGNKRYLYEQLQRWKTSEFVIKQAMHGALRSTPPWLFAINRLFNIVIDLLVVQAIGTDGATPEMVHIILHPAMIEALRDHRQSLSIHPEILRARKPQPFLHLMYYWCRRVVKHSLAPQIYRLDHLHREIKPSVSLIKFRGELLALLKRHRTHRPNTGDSLIPGYILRYNEQADELMVRVQPDDKIIGENSPAAQATKRVERSVAGEIQKMLHKVTSGDRRGS
jgi:hypothetical protein